MGFARESPMYARISGDDVARAPGQIVLGTDWPNVPHDYEAELRGLRACGVEEATVHAITSENARRLSEAFR
jgi:predicted TIM-barrel fold metal-dependent hydrolase